MVARAKQVRIVRDRSARSPRVVVYAISLSRLGLRHLGDDGDFPASRRWSPQLPLLRLIVDTSFSQVQQKVAKMQQ
jgi:hypothetical protein